MSESESPDWWASAEEEIDLVMHDFTNGLRKKLKDYGDNPVKLLSRKNPFLLRIRGASNVEDFASSMVDASLSSSEETILGNIFELCAQIVCKHGRNGKKSSAEGIDIEYSEGPKKRVLVQVKSGKNWGNSGQKKDLKRSFASATKRLKERGSVKDVRCIEGVCYGRSEQKHINHHERIVGLAFWQEVSGWEGTYFALLEVVGKHGSNGLQSHKKEAVGKIVEFMKRENLSDKPGKINWPQLLQFLNTTHRKKNRKI